MSLLGKGIYNIYYRPKAFISKAFNLGFWKTFQTFNGKRKMEAKAPLLRGVYYNSTYFYDVYFLTGKEFWFQTAFCLYTLQKQSGLNIRAHIIDDGSLTEVLIKQLKSQFQHIIIYRQPEIEILLEKALPPSEFPYLRKLRSNLPLLKKLTDIHSIPSSSPKLFLDSDILFFKRPNKLIEWLQNPTGFIFQRDVQESYGYKKEFLKELVEFKEIPSRLNSGMSGMDSTVINWKSMEVWVKEMLEREGQHYLQEQALTALLASHFNHEFFNEFEYKVLPSIKSKKIPEIAHHYAGNSKFDYFVYGWKYALLN